MIADASSTATPWQRLDALDPAVVTAFLAPQHPQAIALIVSRLNDAQGAAVLDRLDPALREEVVHRLARLGAPPPMALEIIEQTLAEELTRLESVNPPSPALSDGDGDVGAARVAALLNRLPGDAASRLQEGLAQRDADLGAKVRDRRLVFEDLAQLDDRHMQRLLRELSDGIFPLCLKGAPKPLLRKVLGNLSRRGAESVRDVLLSMGPRRVEDVRNARKGVLQTARRLAEAGEIVLPGDAATIR